MSLSSRSQLATQTPDVTSARSWSSPNPWPWSSSSSPSAGSHFTSSTASPFSALPVRTQRSSCTPQSPSPTATRPSTPSFTLSALRNSARPSGKSGNCTCSVRIRLLGSLREAAREDGVMTRGCSRTTTTMMCDPRPLIRLLRNFRASLRRPAERNRCCFHAQRIPSQKWASKDVGKDKWGVNSTVD